MSINSNFLENKENFNETGADNQERLKQNTNKANNKIIVESNIPKCKNNQKIIKQEPNQKKEIQKQKQVT